MFDKVESSVLFICGLSAIVSTYSVKFLTLFVVGGGSNFFRVALVGQIEEK